jgi:hypothetical protein
MRYGELRTMGPGSAAHHCVLRSVRGTGVRRAFVVTGHDDLA